MPCCCLLPVSLPLALPLGLLCLHHNRGRGGWEEPKLQVLTQTVEPACGTGDPGSIPGLGRYPGRGHGNPLQYPGRENPTDREEEPGGLQSMGSHRVRQDLVIRDEHFHFLLLSGLLGFRVPLPQAGGPELCVLLQLEERGWGVGGHRSCITDALVP